MERSSVGRFPTASRARRPSASSPASGYSATIMRRTLSRLAWYSGIRWGDPDSGADRASPDVRLVRLVPARADLRRDAVLLFALGVITGAAMLAVFGQPALKLLPGLAAGVVLWGALQYMTRVHRMVPDVDDLLVAPEDAHVSVPHMSRLRLLLVLALCVPPPPPSSRPGV